MTDVHIGKWTERRAQLTPHKIAVRDMRAGKNYTFLDIHRRVTALSAGLAAGYGVKKGDRLAVLAKNRPEMLEIFFAAAKLGAIIVPLNFRLTGREIKYMADDCQPLLIFLEDEFRSLLAGPGEHTPPLVSFGPDYENLLLKGGNGLLSPAVTPEDILMILYTGGTTGFPKGALLSHRMIFWNAINTTISWGLRQDDVAPVFTPLFHTGGWNVFLTPLFHLGGTVLLFDTFEPEEVAEVFDRYNCTIGFMVPTMYQMLIGTKAFLSASLAGVRFFISGGAPCPQSIFQTFWERGLNFKQGYGLTEAGPNCFALDQQDILTKSPSVGKPVFYSDVRLIDSKGADVANGEVGELIIKGPHVCSGYFNNQKATRESLYQGYFLTGDLARRDEEGFYYIVDRRKHMIISGGENIYPTEIEEVISRHPAVLDAAVVGVPDEKWGEKVKAVVVLKEGESVAAGQITEFAREFLGGYKVPKIVEFRTQLPRNAAGKILKQELL
jgi:fatty-acyl-CoA synthase